MLGYAICDAVGLPIVPARGARSIGEAARRRAVVPKIIGRRSDDFFAGVFSWLGAQGANSLALNLRARN